MKLLRLGACSLLIAFCLAALPGCDSSEGNGTRPNSDRDKIEKLAPLSQSEQVLILSANGRTLEGMIQEIESVVEARVLAGNQMNMSAFTKLLDASFEVHCDFECTIKERKIK